MWVSNEMSIIHDQPTGGVMCVLPSGIIRRSIVPLCGWNANKRAIMMWKQQLDSIFLVLGGNIIANPVFRVFVFPQPRPQAKDTIEKGSPDTVVGIAQARND